MLLLKTSCFILATLCIPLASALKGASGCGYYICVNATYDGHTVTCKWILGIDELTSLKQPTGWLALGFGRRMAGSQMVAMWDNGDGSVTLSQRYATGHREPLPILTNKFPRRAVPVKPRRTSWHPPNSTTVAFRIPANKTLLQSEDPTEHLIWAYSKVKPLMRYETALLHAHYAAGMIALDVTKDIPDIEELPEPHTTHHHVSHTTEELPKPTTLPEASIDQQLPPSTADITDLVTPTGPIKHRDTIILAHGFFVSLGFLVILPSGSLIARFCRTMTPKWFKVHQTMNMLVALPVITIGWLLGPVAVFQHQAEHFLDAHQICGVLLLALYYLQITLGRYIHRNRAMNVRPHPPSNILHVVLGLTVIALAFFQVRSGWYKYEEVTGGQVISQWWRDAWGFLIVLVPLAYLGGLVLLPKQFDQERQTVEAVYSSLLREPQSGPRSNSLESVREFASNNETVVPLLNKPQ
ncbi:hypothetical protein AMATHDRAFT_139927 [Amanita thiersii Skay4041]|uniref:Cytochrome b561 domain-containing protein n=1 Tax=Amanita thiersii Skay4041 TaxID=703135 RepID=A0A2A9NWY1_9AGAR|nr:hypothetical protein AMATHDRAFT_139927 [Amanita thiersii Skay4041]